MNFLHRQIEINCINLILFDLIPESLRDEKYVYPTVVGY